MQEAASLTARWALASSGDQAGAREWARKALDASRRYDDPTSPTIAEAESAVQAAAGAQPR